MKPTKRRVWMVGICVSPLMLIMLLASPARAQAGIDIGMIITYLQQILGTVGQQTKPALATQTSVNGQLNFLQNTMYPTGQMNTIRSQSTQYGQAMSSGQTMFASPVNSATLPQTSAFEGKILGGNPNNINSIGTNE
mgnify:CR=1 FL=1